MQPLLSTSLIGWGVGSLDQDADELSKLAQHLKSQFESEVRITSAGCAKCTCHNQRQTSIPSAAQAFILAGHSTGCQDAVRFANRPDIDPPDGVILQAPVHCRAHLLPAYGYLIWVWGD